MILNLDVPLPHFLGGKGSNMPHTGGGRGGGGGGSPMHAWYMAWVGQIKKMSECRDSGNESSKESGGMDFSFVQPPPDDLICSICLLVQREPVLTSCCGNHFCNSCVQKVKLEQRPCPLCGSENFTTMLDKYFSRKVNELEVACIHKNEGCLWQGRVSLLEKHVDPEKGDCKYMRIECPFFCGTILNYTDIEKHKNACHKRPYACKFCGYKGVYEDMSTKHWRMCEKYPLPCPNNCGEVDIERRYMEKHKLDCSLQKRDCEFSFAGCTQCLNSGDMSEHLANSVQYHLSIMSKQCSDLSQMLPREFRSQIEKKMESKDTEIKSLKLKLKENDDEISLLRAKVASLEDELDDIKIDCFNLKSAIFIPPFEFLMTEFRKHKLNQEQWLSPAFYTHFGGYKLCITVDANGSEEGHGSYVSVYVNLMKGEYDNHLKWPFTGSISIQLCNQREDRGNFEEQIMFTYDASEIAGRVREGVLAEQGLGIPTFIEHAKLGFNSKKNIEYLKNDCLRFRVLRVDFMKRRNTNTR